MYRHRKDLAPEIDSQTQARFDAGNKIGELAIQYFGHGVEVTNEYWDVKGAVEATKKFIARGEDIIFEATAIHPIDGGYYPTNKDLLECAESHEKYEEINMFLLSKLKKQLEKIYQSKNNSVEVVIKKNRRKLTQAQ